MLPFMLLSPVKTRLYDIDENRFVRLRLSVKIKCYGISELVSLYNCYYTLVRFDTPHFSTLKHHYIMDTNAVFSTETSALVNFKTRFTPGSANYAVLRNKHELV